MIGVSLSWDLLLRLTLLFLSLPFVPRLLLASAPTSDTNISTFNSAAVTPWGTSVPITTATFLSPTVSRGRSGTVIVRNFWDFSGQKDQTVASVVLHHARRSTYLFNATVVDQHAGRPSSSHSIQPSVTAGNLPTHSTETLRPLLVLWCPLLPFQLLFLPPTLHNSPKALLQLTTSTSSNAITAANNTVNNINFTSGTGTGAANTSGVQIVSQHAHTQDLHYPLPSIFLWTMFIQCPAVGWKSTLADLSNAEGVGKPNIMGRDFRVQLEVKVIDFCEVRRMLMTMNTKGVGDTMTVTVITIETDMRRMKTGRRMKTWGRKGAGDSGSESRRALE